MPPVILPALAAGISIGIQSGVVAGLIAAGVTAALSGAAYALREEPDLGQGPLGAGLQISTLAPAQPRQILYGRNRIGGQIVMRAVTGHQHNAFHQIIVWAGHEVEAIEAVYANDETIPQTFATVTATDIFFEDLGDEIKSTTTDLEAVFPESGTVFTVAGSVGQDGLYRIKNTIAQDTAPHELNVERLDGDGSINGTTPGPSITLTETYSRLSNHLGSASQAADATAVAEIPQWTSSHTLSGCAYSYATLYYSQVHWKTGQPNHTAIVKGKKCYDPRDGTTGYTRNPALISADWLTDTTYGLGVPYANLDEASLIAAANVCDELVTTTAGSVERYTCDAVIRANEDRRAVLQRLAASMAGHVVQTGAVWTFKAGAFETPTVTLDESDLRGPVRITPKRSRQELFNSVKAGYRDAALDWQPTDMPHVQDAGALAQDNGEALWRTLRYDYTTDREAVTRLAKIALLRNREQATVNLRVGLSGLAITAGDTIGLSIERYGWSSKAFFVEQWGLSQYNDAHGAPALGVELVLRATSADVYSWDAGEASPTPPPEALPTPDWATMDAPLSLTAVSGLGEILTAGDGTIISRIRLTWEMPEGALANRFEVRYRRNPADAPAEEWTYVQSAAPTTWIEPVKDQDLYDLHVRAFNALGVPSAWTKLNAYPVDAKSGLPGNVTGFQALAARDRIGLSWAANPERDLSHYLIREGASWAAGTLIARTDSTRYQTPEASNGPWWIKAVDTSGNESEDATGASITPVLPIVTNITGQVVDNNVLLRWSSTVGTFNIRTYEVRKGDDAATAETVGDSDKTFDVVFETASGTYTYHIVPVDAAGNEGDAESITLSVDAPPDFILRNRFQTDWEGFAATSVQPLFSVPLPYRLTTRDQTALEFDGVDDYVDVGDAASFDPGAQSFTVEALFRTTSTTGFRSIFNKTDGSPFPGWLLRVNNNDSIHFRISDGVNAPAIQTPGFFDGRFHHAAGVVDRTAQELRLYIDGALVGTADTSAVGSVSAVQNLLLGDLWDGELAELRYWLGVARTESEIQAWMHRTLDGNETGLAGYWRAQGGSGETIADKSGNANDGAIVGASWHKPTVRAAIPFPAAETVAERETTHGYATPQAQIDAGYPYVAQPVPTTASFAEVYDAGATIPSTKISVTLAGSDVVAGVTTQITLSTRAAEGDPWTDYPAGQAEVFATAFRYVKVTVDYTSDGAAFRNAQDIATVLATKIKNDSGKVTVSANPTTVSFNVEFVDVEAITATPQGTTAKLVMVDFTDVPSPTEFDLYLFNADGTAATGDVRWSARGF